MFSRNLVRRINQSSKLNHSSGTFRYIKGLFSDNNLPDNRSDKKTHISRGDADNTQGYDGYMEEPKRMGISYKEYAQQQLDLEEKKKAIEVTSIKDQIKDETNPYEVTSSEREFHRKMQLDIAQFKLTKPSDYYSSNIGEREYGVFDFSDTSLIQKPGKLIIDGILEDGFTVSKIQFQGPIIVFPTQVFFWDVYEAEDIRSHNFELLKFIKPRPSNTF